MCICRLKRNRFLRGSGFWCWSGAEGRNASLTIHLLLQGDNGPVGPPGIKGRKGRQGAPGKVTSGKDSSGSGGGVTSDTDISAYITPADRERVKIVEILIKSVKFIILGQCN